MRKITLLSLVAGLGVGSLLSSGLMKVAADPRNESRFGPKTCVAIYYCTESDKPEYALQVEWRADRCNGYAPLITSSTGEFRWATNGPTCGQSWEMGTDGREKGTPWGKQ